MSLDLSSVLKAGAIAAVVSAVVGILSAIPLIGPLFWVCVCFGGILIPVSAGVMYGYFAPGKEDLTQGAIGGALSGVAAGLIYGIFSILTTAVVALVTGDNVFDIMAESAVNLFGTFCGAIFFGGILGAIGGVVWLAIQGRE